MDKSEGSGALSKGHVVKRVRVLACVHGMDLGGGGPPSPGTHGKTRARSTTPTWKGIWAGLQGEVWGQGHMVKRVCVLPCYMGGRGLGGAEPPQGHVVAFYRVTGGGSGGGGAPPGI